MKTAESRKIETNKYLESKGIPICEHLPLIEDNKSVKIRMPKEIAIRAMILTGLIDSAYEVDRNEIIEWLKGNNLWKSVSKSEKQYLNKVNLDDSDKIEMSWRTEALFVLFWSLGLAEKLEEPTKECNLSKVHERANQKYGSIEDFITQSKTRDVEEILDETDIIYRTHWAVRDAGLKDESYPKGYNPSIVYERHYALNWITHYQDDWDDITTDT